MSLAFTNWVRFDSTVQKQKKYLREAIPPLLAHMGGKEGEKKTKEKKVADLQQESASRRLSQKEEKLQGRTSNEFPDTIDTALLCLSFSPNDRFPDCKPGLLYASNFFFRRNSLTV